MERTIKSRSVFVDISALILSLCFLFNKDISLYRLRKGNIVITDSNAQESRTKSRFVVRLWRHPFGQKSGSDEGETCFNAPWWKEVEFDSLFFFNYFLYVIWLK